MDKEKEQLTVEQAVLTLDKTKVELTVKQDDDDIVSFDIGLFFKYIKSRIFSLAIVLLVSAAVGAATLALYYFVISSTTGEVSLIYNLSFPGIDDGKNPWGGTYIASEMMAAEVLTNALELSKINNDRKDIITVEDVRQNLKIQGILSDDAMDRVLAVNELVQKDPTKIMELVGLNYYPVQYKLTLQIPKEWNLSEEGAAEFLNLVVTCYYDWFVKTYGDFSFIAALNEGIDFDRYDYEEQVQICQNSLASIISYLRTKDAARPDFVSPSKGIKFIDILSHAEIVRTVDIDTINSLIYAFSLTKDKERLLAVYDARLISYNLELASNKQTVTVIEDAISAYERLESTILMPTLTSGDMSYKTSDSAEYDSLTRQKVAANQAVIETQRRIDSLYDRMNRLISDTLAYSTKSKYVAVVEESIVKLLEDINYLSEMTNIVAEEYYETYEFRDGVRLTVPAQFFPILGLKTIALIGGGIVAGLLFIALLWISLKAFFYVNRQQCAQLASIRAAELKA